MQKSMMLTGAMALVLLTGCEKAEAPAPTDTQTTTEEVPVETVPAEGAEATDPATAPHRVADWAGKWTGVEGMYATITPTEPGKYKLEMQSDLDTKGTYGGEDSEHGIKFKRGSDIPIGPPRIVLYAVEKWGKTTLSSQSSSLQRITQKYLTPASHPF